MNEGQKELVLDLLVKKAVYGLEEAEQRALDEMDDGTAAAEFSSIELATTAVGMLGLDTKESLPAHLRAKIIIDADRHFAGAEGAVAEPWPPPVKPSEKTREGWGSFFSWFGWVAAAAACIALAVNIYMTRFQPPEIVQAPPVAVETPQPLTPEQQREQLMQSGTAVVKANWAPGNVKEIKQITGDVVWSEEKQAGYLRFRGLPVRTAPDFCYQLWIFDKTQDPKRPIDGGTFDVNAEGEIIVPINAKLRAEGVYMFALTIERHGGVVVSDREKIAALAKVENPSV